MQIRCCPMLCDGCLLQAAERPGLALHLLMGASLTVRLGAGLASAGMLAQLASQSSLCTTFTDAPGAVSNSARRRAVGAAQLSSCVC
jgi:hypothetical protein